MKQRLPLGATAARLQRDVVAALSGLVVVHAYAPAAAEDAMAKHSETPAEPRSRNISFGGGASAGLAMLRTNAGSWLEAFLVAQVPLASWLLLRFEPGVFTAVSSETDPYYANTDRIRVTGGLIRSLFEPKFADSIGFRLGFVAGYAVTTLDSTVCGSDHAAAWFVGPLAGPAVHVGPFDFAVEASLPVSLDLRCNAGPVIHASHDLAHPVALLRAGYVAF